MPSPVVLKVQFAAGGLRPRSEADGQRAPCRSSTTRPRSLTWPVDVWFSGSRTFEATLDFGGRAIERSRSTRLPLPGPRPRRQRLAEAGTRETGPDLAGRSNPQAANTGATVAHGDHGPPDRNPF